MKNSRILELIKIQWNIPKKDALRSYWKTSGSDKRARKGSKRKNCGGGGGGIKGFLFTNLYSTEMPYEEEIEK
jgi:hypothetical protein